jgi:hypothetical protein
MFYLFIYLFCRPWCSNFNTVIVRGYCVVFVFVLSVMPSYSNTKLANLHFIYGLCNGNTRASQREYENRFPGRRVPIQPCSVEFTKF